MRVAHVLALASLASLLASTPASAASLSLTDDKYTTGTTLRYTAAPGEANRLTVSGRVRPEAPYAPPTELLFHDDGAAVEAGACRQVDRQTAACQVGLRVVADLGDRSDTATAHGSAADFDVALVGGGGDDDLRARSTEGGSGDDVLVATGQGASLRGGTGSDLLVGGPGGDFLEPDGDSTSRSNLQASDVVLGGAGQDTVAYLAPYPVVVDLAAGRARQVPAGTVDALTDVESAITGRGDDVLIGSRDANRLAAGKGDDRLLGGLGDDILDGGDGLDRLEGGAGNDSVDAEDDNREADTVACGPGVDRLSTGDEAREGFARDRFGPDCERLSYASIDDVPAIPVGVPEGPRAVVPVGCGTGPCRATVTLRVDGRLVGQAARRIPRVAFGVAKPVMVPLRRSGKGRELAVSTTWRSGKLIERSGYRVRLR